MYDDFFTTDKRIKTITNGESSVFIYQKENGDVYSSDGHFKSNINNDDFEDSLNEFESDWHEVNWTTEDYAEYFGCDADELDDYMYDF